MFISRLMFSILHLFLRVTPSILRSHNIYAVTSFVVSFSLSAPVWHCWISACMNSCIYRAHRHFFFLNYDHISKVQTSIWNVIVNAIFILSCNMISRWLSVSAILAGECNIFISASSSPTHPTS